MSGRVIGIVIVLLAIISGVAIYWLQLFAYYENAPDTTEITLINMATGAQEAMAIEDFQGIDANSSPLRFRACFSSVMSDVTLSETYEAYDLAPTPLVAPGWFDCFDAVEIGEALEAGQAMAFISQRDIHDGVDRVVAVFPDGRGYAWHQLNEKYQD